MALPFAGKFGTVAVMPRMNGATQQLNKMLKNKLTKLVATAAVTAGVAMFTGCSDDADSGPMEGEDNDGDTGDGPAPGEEQPEGAPPEGTSTGTE
ncbi:MAG: hypothetical protein H8E27_00755 [Verrucomicrobia subdivision 3 bacterium]|nr:hypothetical protein [Limisphaerales bacterium]